MKDPSLSQSPGDPLPGDLSLEGLWLQGSHDLLPSPNSGWTVSIFPNILPQISLLTQPQSYGHAKKLFLKKAENVNTSDQTKVNDYQVSTYSHRNIT